MFFKKPAQQDIIPITHTKYRPDIDGLRAVAILLVIIFHGFPRFIKGGFIGVDIFFVISGYLITTIILSKLEQGNFSLLDFYGRRIKRIFPSLIVVLLFCLAFGWYLLLADEYQLLGKHIAAGALYISNFILQSEVGYFDTAAEYKPLLHLWSLAIEEQFYLVFPLLLILIFRSNINPLPFILLSLGISFCLNMVQIENDPTGVFFYPQTRVWELLIGSWVAYINLHARQQFDDLMARFFRHSVGINLLASSSTIIILIAWLALDNLKISFPNAWALLPTLGAAGLILAGENAWFNRRILANKLVVSIGLISYPLYLWHWPLLVFLRIIEVDRPSSFARLVTLLASVLLAWLTYFLVEKQIRFRKHWAVAMSLLICLIMVGGAGYYVNLRDGFPNRFNFQNSWIEGAIGNGIWEKTWVKQKQCLNKFGREFDFCLIQDIDKPPTVLLVGDSHGNHLYPGLLKITHFKHDNVLNLGEGSCPALFDIPRRNCTSLMNRALDLAITTPSIHTVVLSHLDMLNLNDLFDKNTTEKQAGSVFQQLLRSTLQKLLLANKQIVFITDTPSLGFNASACMQRPWRMSNQNGLTPCAVPFVQVQRRRESFRTLQMQVLNEFPKIKVWDTTQAFCDQQYCWAVKENKMLYRDDDHLNEVGSRYLADYLNTHY